MIIKILDKLLGIEKPSDKKTVDSIKHEIMTAKMETVESIQKMNRMLESRNVTLDIHIATGGNRT